MCIRDREMDQLTIRECAMLAGMVQKPYNTNPRLNIYQRTLTDAKREELEELYASGAITEAQYRYSLDNNNQMYVTDRRTNVVLLAMYEGGFITKDQYEAALQDTVTVLEESSNNQLYDCLLYTSRHTKQNQGPKPQPATAGLETTLLACMLKSQDALLAALSRMQALEIRFPTAALNQLAERLLAENPDPALLMGELTGETAALMSQACLLYTSRCV